MFNKTNIYINQKRGENLKNKNFLINIFPNKIELAILTFLIYFTGVIYQILKLIGGFTTNPKFGNLMFFSFSNSVNDFLIIFGISLIFFFLSFIVSFIFIKGLNSINITKNKKITFLVIIGVVILYSIIIFLNNGFQSFKTSLYIMIPFLLSVIITCLIIFNLFNKKYFFIFNLLYLFFGFYILQYDGPKYYACEKLKDNTAEENCFIIIYKNDKYGFTGSGDIYKLDEFKSFFTSEYFKIKKTP